MENQNEYYSELYEDDREAKIDSLKKLRPPFKTRAGRTVYGGGGVTPDIYIPYKLKLNASSRKIMSHPNRLMFNWSTNYVSSNKLPSFEKFQTTFMISDKDLKTFFKYVKEQDSEIDNEEALKDADYLKTMLKSEIAGVKWGINQLWSIRVNADNQVMQSMEHFEKAKSFLN